MTNYTPAPETVEVAARAWHEAPPPQGAPPGSWDDLPDGIQALARAYMTAALSAAGPLIERAAAERIEAEADRIDPDPEDWPADPSDAGVASGLRRAARIARGDGA